MNKFLVALALLATPCVALAEEYAKPMGSFGLGSGNSYTADAGVAWYQYTMAAIFDYEAIMPHPAPDDLRMKFELSYGVALEPRARGFAAADVLAMKYFPQANGVRPYVEAGIGLIYTDFKREGQGLRFNFNPVAGLGFEKLQQSGDPWGYVALRFHHVSNAGLDSENTGINSAFLTFGKYF